MRILFLSAWFPIPADNGSKIRVKHLIQALAKRHAVTLVSFSFGTAEPQAADVLGCEAIHAIDIDPFQRNKAGILRRSFSFTPAMYRPIPRMEELVNEVFRKADVDLVISSTELMATYAFQAAPGVKKILEEHNSLTRQIYERYEVQRGGFRTIRNRLSYEKARHYEGHLFSHFDKVIMVSAEDKRISEMALPGFAGPVALIPNGVDCRHNRQGLVQKQNRLLVFNGSITYGANFDAMRFFLAEIYPSIRKEVPSIRLLVTGSTAGVDLSRLALDESVELTGYVHDIRLPVGAATVCVVPLRSGGGTRLKILEAMALGTAVVSTPKGAEGLGVVDGEHLLLAEEPRDFASKVVRLLNAATLRQRLTTNARQFVEEGYDWQFIGTKFLQLVETTARSGSAG